MIAHVYSYVKDVLAASVLSICTHKSSFLRWLPGCISSQNASSPAISGKSKASTHIAIMNEVSCLRLMRIAALKVLDIEKDDDDYDDDDDDDDDDDNDDDVHISYLKLYRKSFKKWRPTNSSRLPNR